MAPVCPLAHLGGEARTGVLEQRGRALVHRLRHGCLGGQLHVDFHLERLFYVVSAQVDARVGPVEQEHDPFERELQQLERLEPEACVLDRRDVHGTRKLTRSLAATAWSTTSDRCGGVSTTT